MKKEFIKEAVNELNALVSLFRFAEALEKVYSKIVICYENETLTADKLENHLSNGKKYLDSISNNKAILKNSIISGNLSVSHWHYVFDHTQWGHWDCEQITVQRWKEGKIIEERHYYEND